MNRRLSTSMAILVAFALLVAACGNSGDEGADPADADTTTTAAPDSTTPDTEPTDAPDGSGRDEFVPLEGVPGVTDDEIGVGVIGLTANNPLGTCILECYVTGIQAYFDYQNSLGGVFGRDLVIAQEFDDELFQNQVKALELIADGESFAAFGATLNPGGYGDLQDAGVPTFVWGIQSPELAGRDALFGHLGVFCGSCTGRGTPYLVKLAGGTKVATLGYGISPESQTCAKNTADSVTQYGADIGAEVVKIYDDLEFGLPNGIGPQVTEMINLGVDYVATCMDLNAMKTLAQEFERQNYRDKVTLQHPNTYNADFVAETGNLFDGDFVSPQFVPFEFTDFPEIKVYNQWVDAQGGAVAEQTMIGWINATLFVDGLLATGPEFDRASLIETINTTFTAHSANGLINPVDWTRQHDAPTPEDAVTNGPVNECLTVVQMQDGAFEKITDEPFLCWSNSTDDWSEPVPTTFE